ncbi:glycosyl hydrolase, partial [bacterium]
MSRALLLLLALLVFVSPALAADDDEGPFNASTFSGLGFRELGPALTSGRISDIAVHPDHHNEWMVTTVGGVWHTVNAGTTWTPVFDGEGSYSIGCVAYDPTNPLIVWVGTGENNSQRSVSYGDGIYRSADGGQSWEKVGLDDSQHIGKILVHPVDGNTVFVAAQGPLWNPGGDRGLYKTTDGGATWEKILEISDDTGVTDVVMDPRDPDVLYAAAYQRRRHTWTLLNGGPEGAIYKSTDGGASWDKLERGLPEGDVGRIGLGIAPTDGNKVYAIIEAAGDESGFYRSIDAGVSWKKMSDYVSGSPQYYNEIIVSPHDADLIYSNDTWLQRSYDGGVNWTRINNGTMHVDNHAVWIDPNDPAHIVVGNDGGVYETFDDSAHWSFKWNLPITQFYKIAIDDDFPFYNVYGGTQDNNTIGGATRNTSANGIRNDNWFITLGGDGFEPAIEPGNPDIVYSQWQYGNLMRYDRKSGENTDIQPQPKVDDEPFVWNWSSGFLISPHSPTRLYFGGNFLFRSEDRGDTWTQLGGNMTRQIDRNELEIMGRVWSVDAVAKNVSTSKYGNIVAIEESPLVEDLIYIGTDDGLIWVSEDGGQSFERHDSFSGVPDMSYVTALTASLHDADVVFVTFSNHKQGDFEPYVLRSDNRGGSWKSIAGNLPERGQAHDIVQDHVDGDLLFCGTEFGVFFSQDGGQAWTQLKGKIPTIACRDLELQRRESDLVVGTFGRGFWVLDDYSALRTATAEALEQEAVIFPVRDSWMFFERSPLGLPGRSSMGHQVYMAENPPVAATFTYWLKDGLQTRTELRQASEEEVWQKGENLHYP